MGVEISGHGVPAESGSEVLGGNAVEEGTGGVGARNRAR